MACTTTQEYLDKIKSKLDITSDYSLAKILGITRQTISRYQKGHGQFDDDVAIRAAKILEINPGIVMIDMYRERSQSEEVKNIWKKISEGFLPLLPHARQIGLYPTWQQ